MVNSNTNKFRLIVHEELKQSVRPTIVPYSLLVVLLFVVFCTVLLQSNQVLKHDGLCPDRLCESNQLFTSDMENVLRYGFFSSAQPLEEAMSGTSANAGYLCSGLSNAQTAVVQFAATNIQGFVCFRVYDDEDILLPSVYPNYSSRSFRFSLFNFNCKTQPPLSLRELQLGIGPLAFGERSGLVRNQFAPNAHACFSDVKISFPTQRNAGFFVDCQTPFAVGLHGAVGRDNMTKQRTGQLGRKIEFISDCSVKLTGQGVGVAGFLSFVDDIGQPVSGFLVGSRYFAEPRMVAHDFQFVGSQSTHTTLYSDVAYENFVNSKNYLRKMEKR